MAVRYTAAALSLASRPVVLTIGRESNRRGWRWVSRWFVRAFRTWTAKPLSVPQMFLLQAAGTDPVAAYRAMKHVLRAVLPRRWWYHLTGDPVALILALPPALVQQVTRALVTVPNTDRNVSKESDDPFAELAALQRKATAPMKEDDGVSLAVATLTVRAAYGDAWYYDTARWPTADGYVPFGVAIVEHAGMQALEIRRRLEVAEGMALTHAKPYERARLRRLAYPGEGA